MFPEKLRNQLRCPNRSNISILIVASCLAGCTSGHFVDVESRQPFAPKVEEFLPLDLGTKNSTYSVDGTRTNYVLKTKKDGTEVSFQAISEGTIVDEEIYDVNDQSIFLKAAAGENFEPPILLLKFPLRVGDHYPWKGKLCCEIERISGTAMVTTSTDFVRGKDKSDDAIKAEMILKFGEGANRKLSFWFVKGKGILKTEMAKNVREPKN